ncbi:hypothetical protein CDD83_7384 [Cordyceps sp. RAO-2017]|nr:hypothetical protein CDD83_7384 [Cordyceps sp. RAO-2017]
MNPSRHEVRADGQEAGSDSLPLSSDEQRVLDLFDTLQQLRLEIAVMNALARHRAGTLGSNSAPVTSDEDVLEARAKLQLRDAAVEAVMVANPILKAVHNGTDATPAERDLLPYVEQRDEAVLSAAKQATELETLRGEVTKVQAETVRVGRRNVELTKTLCDLADQVKQRRTGDAGSPEARRAVARLEEEIVSRRRRWRVIKGVASGIVAGSGIDWARDEDLCDIVLDPETEDQQY